MFSSSLFVEEANILEFVFYCSMAEMFLTKRIRTKFCTLYVAIAFDEREDVYNFVLGYDLKLYRFVLSSDLLSSILTAK